MSFNMQGIEIEKKYKIKQLPKDLEKYEKIEIEQAYLVNRSKITVRVRKYNKDKFILSYKMKKKKSQADISVCDEAELLLTEEAYEHLKEKCDGKVLKKTRYIIPLNDGLKVEIDRFNDFFNGVCFAEIEFKSEEQAKNYKIPDWLGEDISKEKRVKNGYMATVAENIDDYKDLII
ncbi:MAG: adenylate cyclase [Clostridia bacterium]|nr:adenylate cyclase [Clostridia bacterium]